MTDFDAERKAKIETDKLLSYFCWMR